MSETIFMAGGQQHGKTIATYKETIKYLEAEIVHLNGRVEELKERIGELSGYVRGDTCPCCENGILIDLLDDVDKVIGVCCPNCDWELDYHE